MKENKLKLIKNPKHDIKLIESKEFYNPYLYARLVDYSLKLYSMLGIKITKQMQPELKIVSTNAVLNKDSLIVNIKTSKHNRIIIDGYKVTGLMLSTNKLGIYVQLLDINTNKYVYTMDKEIARYLNHRRILSYKRMYELGEEICKTLNIDIDKVMYSEEEKKYILYYYSKDKFEHSTISIKNLEETSSFVEEKLKG